MLSITTTATTRFFAAAIPASSKRATASRQPLTVINSAGSGIKREGPGQAYCKTLPGISAPFDKPYWDPAGLCNEFTTVGELKRWREAELTHGRVSMLAVVGFLVGENIEDFPLFGGVVKGPAVTQFDQLPGVFWVLLVLAIGIAETYRVSIGWATPTGAGFNQLKDDYTPGDLRFDPLNLLPADTDEVYALKTKELNNGRLAMIAIAGFVAQEFAQAASDGVPKEIFEHLFATIGYDIEFEVDKVEEAAEILVKEAEGLCEQGVECLL